MSQGDRAGAAAVRLDDSIEERVARLEDHFITIFDEVAEMKRVVLELIQRQQMR